eukprot:3096732-Prymnesium_polylepis.1
MCREHVEEVFAVPHAPTLCPRRSDDVAYPLPALLDPSTPVAGRRLILVARLRVAARDRRRRRGRGRRRHVRLPRRARGDCGSDSRPSPSAR